MIISTIHASTNNYAKSSFSGRKPTIFRPINSSISTDQLTFCGKKSEDYQINLSDISQTRYKSEIVCSENKLPQLANFIEKTFNNQNSSATELAYAEIYKKDLKHGAYICAVSDKMDQKIIGTGTLKQNGFIYSVCVDSDHRRQKIATSIMKLLIKEAKNRDLKQVYLTASNPHAISLYKSLGFTEHPKGSDSEVEMVLKLKSSPITRLFKDFFESLKLLWFKVYSNTKAAVKQFFK